MPFVTAIVLALALAMDATAAAAGRGIAAQKVGVRETALVAAWFGTFQGGMALLGWIAGASLRGYVEAWDHWIAFVLLTAIGAKTAYEGLRPDREERVSDPFAVRAMFVLAVATSVDAMAAGVTLPLLAVPPFVSILLIGVVTAITSAIGLHAGRKLGAAIGRRLDVLGGVILIALGVKILLEHTVLA